MRVLYSEGKRERGGREREGQRDRGKEKEREREREEKKEREEGGEGGRASKYIGRDVFIHSIAFFLRGEGGVV